MSEKNPFKVFVTHEFREDAEYNRVFEYLESRDNFFYLNFSDPEAQQADAAADVLQESLRAQIKLAEVVLLPAGMLTGKAGLVDFEIKVAQAFDLPIVLIQPFGGTMSIPKEAMEIAAEIVDWDERQIIDAIRRAARGEDTAQWDVIEFDMEDFKLDDDDS
ncbi:MAG: hypothetical protein HKN56_00875 [Gammaproteobacteria bacterium]|nr:hypothetical protein [Gammaproteobacteria bacterium]